jgi:hypothetical protein
MKHPLLTPLICLLLASSLSAETHTITNKDGKSIEVELVAIEGENLVVKTANKSIANIPLTNLTDKDQEFLKTWWEKHRNKPEGLDVRISVEKKTERIDRKVTRSGGSNKNKQGKQTSPVVNKVTKDGFHFIGTLKNYSRKDISDIEVTYTIYKRITSNDGKATKTETKEIRGEEIIRSLSAKGEATFETEQVECEDTSLSGGNKPRTYKRETILGVVFSFSTSSGDFLTHSYPDGFEARADNLE